MFTHLFSGTGVRHHNAEEGELNADRSLYTLYSHTSWNDPLCVQIFVSLA